MTITHDPITNPKLTSPLDRWHASRPSHCLYRLQCGDVLGLSITTARTARDRERDGFVLGVDAGRT